MNKNGFTLLELLFAVLIGLLTIFAIYSLSDMGQHSSASISQKVVTQQDTRAVLDIMAMDIRMASYNPSGKDNSAGNLIWVDKDGASISEADNRRFMKGIQIAGKNEIMIEMDINGNGSVGCTEQNEVIRYKYDSNTKTISRISNCGADTQNILGGAGSDSLVTNNETATNLFTYWGPDIDNPDANENCPDINITDKVSSSTASIAQKWIPQIRRIEITIVTDTEQPDAQTKQKRRMTYSTGVIARNHVLSPPFAN